MGLLESKLQRQRNAVEDTRTIVTATAFEDGRSFKVHVLSIEAIASGGSAAVLKGELIQATKNPLVALKVFHSTLDAQRRQLYHDLYDKEFAAAKRLGAADRYILPFLGTAVLNNQPVIISMYMQNGNLMDYIKLRSPLIVDRQSLILQVSEALAFLHQDVGLVHGDLKCENILISDDHTALLADFGLSTLIDKDEAGGDTTVTWLREVNTVRFAAPELLTDSATAGKSPRIRSKTPKSDVWAFGMVMVQAFTGKRPWPDCERPTLVAHKILTSVTHPRPREYVTAQGLTNAWWQVCLKCWEFEPSKRPSMQEISAELSFIKQARRYKKQAFELGKQVLCATLMPCGTRLVTGCQDNLVRIWDIASGETVVGPMFGHKNWVLSLAASPSGRQVTSGSDDHTARRWDVLTGAPVGFPMGGYSLGVSCIAYSADGELIATGSLDTTIRVRDSATGATIGKPLIKHTGEVMSLAFSTDGTILASGSYDMTIRLWDAATGESLAVLTGHADGVASLRFIPDLKRIVSASSDRTVRIWHAEKLIQKCERTIRGHRDAIRSVAVSPSGRYIASASDDKTVRVWDAATGDPVGVPLMHPSWVRSIHFCPDGMTLVSIDFNQTVRTWDLYQ